MPQEAKRRQRERREQFKPLKALAPFMFFHNDIIEQVKRERPDLSLLQLKTEIGNRWNDLTSEEKQHYVAIANKEKQKCEEENRSHVSDSAICTYQSSRKKKDPKYPKRCLSAYLFFWAECQKQNPSMKITEIAGELAAQWRQLSDKNKAKYHAAAAKDKERYEAELAAYKEEG